MSLPNPIPLVHSGLWACLESIPDFLVLFPHGTPHQVRYDSTVANAPDEDLPVLKAADYARCRIVRVGGIALPHFDSSESNLGLRFRIEVCTGQPQQSVLDAADWAIYRGYTKWPTVLRDGVSWNGIKCVVSLEVESMEADNTNVARNRDTPQWIGVMQVLITCSFATATLQAN